MVKRENAITVDINVKAIVIRNYIKLGEHVKKIEMTFFYGWLDSAQIFCGFDSRKTRLDSTQTFYGSAFAASAAAPRSKPRPTERGGVPVLPNFECSLLFMLTPLTHNYQI